MPRFGVEFYGRHAIVKMRVAVPQSHLEMIEKSFPDICVTESLRTTKGKFMLALDGCIPIRDYDNFIGCIRNSIIARKMEDLRAEYSHHEYPVEHDIFTNVDFHLPEPFTIADEDELPF